MKLSIERATLLKALAQAQSVVERRNTIPILANVLIEAEGDAGQLPRHRSGHRGGGPRPRHGRTRRGDHRLGRDAARDRAQAARWRAGQPDRRRRRGAADHHGGPVDLQPGDAAEGRFPGDGDLANTPSNFSAPAPVLRRLFDKAKFAISTEETRYYLNGVYMHVADRRWRPGPALRGDRRPPAGPDRRAAARRGRRHARRDRAAQDGGRAAQAAGRRRGDRSRCRFPKPRCALPPRRSR